MQTKYIIDVNKHGIRRDRPAVGYKAAAKIKKKGAGNGKKKDKSRESNEGI